MGNPLRLLLVEDRESDAALLKMELDRLGYDLTWLRVETREAMRAALADPWDIIISDFAMPAFGAREALELRKELGIEIPFIIVSGTIEEEAAVDSLRMGADDFITKSRLSRLGPAIERSLRDFQERIARRAAEARLRQAQRLETVGQLAGGVAHDFNNLLGVIQGYCELILREPGGDGRQHPRLKQILHAADRGAALTRQLLAFSRQQPMEVRPLDLNAVVAQVEPMFRRIIKENIQIVTVLSEGRQVVKADPVQIEQVLMNLVVNARDALEAGGRITIETTNVDLAEEYVATHPDAKAGPYVMLAVSDTGHGMEPATLARLFEPFFTTKEPGKGTGLGLATVYGIVKQSDGHVAVYSEPGRGTTFKVYLPRAAEGPGAAEAGSPAEPTGGSETVLLVEDEPSLRDVIHSLLEDGGYTVIDGADPEASLAAAEAYRGPIHLVLTDVVMPHLSGVQAAERVRRSRPDVKVLFMSGYASAAAEHSGGLPAGHAFLQKPFGFDALLQRVREVLDAPE